MRALAPLLLVALTAGCIGPAATLDPATVPGDLPARVEALLSAALPCEGEASAEPEGSSSTNVAYLGQDPLDEAGAVGAGELWLQGDRAYVARYGTGGFSVVSLADPLAPAEVGTWDPEQTKRGLDVKALADGSAVLVGNDDGVRIVDVRDPRAMAEEHHQPFARTQAHMLTVFRVAGQEYVAVAKGDGEDLPIFRVTGGPGAHALERVASVPLTLATGASERLGQASPHDLTRTHDASFYDDPELGPTLWVANVWDGVLALDVSDPEAPRGVLRIPNDKPQYTHTVQTVVVGEGESRQRVTVAMSEVGVNTLKVWDTTDLAAPRLLAEWSVPQAWKPQHNPQLVPPYLYLAHYEYGVFVFALEDLLAGRAQPVARLASAGGDLATTATPLSVVFDAALNFQGTWDVGLRDGLLYTTDGGLNVAAFGCIAPGDAAQRSIG